MDQTTPQLILVDSIGVHVTTGDTLHPSEDGFAALWAEVLTGDSALKERLARAELHGELIQLRCAMIDVMGKITRQEQIGADSLYVLSVSNLAYRKPNAQANGA